MHLHGRMLYRLYTDSNYFFMDYKLRMAWRSGCVCRFHSDGGAIEVGQYVIFLVVLHRLRIPRQSCHRFHPKVAINSTPKLPLIP